ncbi:hypothetical protein Q0Z83_051720 [Actinoplanes sichuanensis]|uniref:non-specific serine/threonine protein kinase n=1 Tax=Actinoplanes sichuanensis TaxID=512349 RepID=A0ABW4ACQ3_9ACTN|nr:serine/threonine-protein kinase [Actinoplanes sichuanensis]BEL06981.1 hypothetical protein Q0Z83_051720 [Actinoplanes sichuanensis]
MSAGSARVVGGRYRLSGWLGRGGMGAVWAAHDTLLGRDVALKEIFLPEETAGPDDPSIRRAFREARAAARLRHRGIVTVHDVVTEDGRPWIVMELIDGPSLAAAIREHGTIGERRAADIGSQVLDALRAAHRQGVLHRDVKPANILLDTDRVVLTDFGIAAIDDATSITSTGQMIGSPAFLAPERVNGRPASAATDMWALGVTLYTAVTGRSPFPGDDLQSAMAAILHHDPEPPAGAGLLWPVIAGLLLKDPAARLTADQAAPMLAAIIRDRPETVATGRQLAATLPEPTPVRTTVAVPARQPAGPAQRAAGPGYPAGPAHNPRRGFPWQAFWVLVLVVCTLTAAGAILRTTWLQLDGSAAPDPEVSPTPSSSPSSAAPQAIPAAFVGKWSGTAKQPIGVVDSWQVTITFTAASPTGAFDTSLACDGTLAVVEPWPTGREIHLRQQTGWNPRGTCVDAAKVTLRIGDDDRMEMTWQDLGEPLNIATASLTRS